MKTKKLAMSVAVTAGLALLLVLAIPGGKAQGQTTESVKALVVEGLGDSSAIVTTMQSLGWEVTMAAVLDVDQHFDNGLYGYDVIWVTAGTDVKPLQFLARRGNILDQFPAAGGVVVVTDLSPDDMWLDIAPGGPEAQALPASGAGVVTIAAVDHPSITGAGTGGTALTAADLDPQSSGGRACVINPPQDSGFVVIAENSIAPVLLDYKHGNGRVIVSALLSPQESCSENLLRYLQTVVGQ